MRAWWILILLAVPVAAAQATTTAGGPTLAITPHAIDSTPNARVAGSIAFSNPLEKPIAWALSDATANGAIVKLERSEISLAPGSHATVNFSVQLPAQTNVTHVINIYAQETAASMQAAGRTRPLQLKDAMSIRVLAPAIEMRVDPAILDVPLGGEANATLTIVDPGAGIDSSFATKPADGYEITVADPPARIPGDGATTVLSIHVRDVGDHAIGATAETAVGLKTIGRAAPFALRAAAPAPAPPPARPAAAAVAPPPPLDPRLIVGAAIAAGAGLWTALWLSRRKWWPFLAALYTRLAKGKMLEHPVRKRIVEAVLSKPGIAFGDLARAVDIAPGQLTHHARMLEKAGIVFSSPDGQTRRFYHVTHGRLMPVAPLAERALAIVRASPRKASEIARELGVSRQSVHYHLRHLQASGRIRAREDGRLEAIA